MSIDLRPAQLAPAAAAPPRELEVLFTGSGSEYFRIWAVNLLLVLLTLGLYLPFAKARRIRYVYANTLVDGQALAFHGNPWKMLRGFLLLVVFMGAYTLAGEFEPAAAVPVLLLLYAIWPALWRASMQFRLGNTSWRGLRLGFEGGLKEVYLACAPVYLPLVLTTVFTAQAATHGPSADPGVNGLLWSLASTAAWVLMAPWSLARFKRYQHRGYRIAGQHSRVELPTRSVYFIGLKALMLGLFGVFVVVLFGFVIGAVLALIGTGKLGGPGSGTYYGLTFSALSFLMYGALLIPYAATRVQNLVWSRTSSECLRFEGVMDGWALASLTARNWILIVLTLGLYRPFAVMATVRLRLESVRITSSSDPADWVAPRQAAASDATGEVAGDFFGVDMGL
jgi:uncharacterized membrane protein YjgN (DUF898 family)